MKDRIPGPILETSSIREVDFGRKVRIIEPCNLYGCSLGDDVFVGPFVEIQRGVIIGARTRVQSHSFICEGVTLGEDCVISHGVMFINDLLRGGPARGDRSLWRKTQVANGVAIGTNATILPVRIGENVVIGAGAVVTRDITEPGNYAGNPARKVLSSR